ncbi:MAG: GMC family oxidoreductase, partial [Proteobacteria bacterium]|nr:GMC family oxidoreductase [Pseudomonadota bacterium]
MADLVVGSGPSGVTVAGALLARGREVVMLDVGKGLEPDRAAARDTFASAGPAGWSRDDIARWQGGQVAAPPGRVRRFGSDFAMEPPEATFAEGADHFHLRASNAQGGLSNLWGSALLPYRAADMAGWPVTADELAPHYAAVAAFLPVSGTTDALGQLFRQMPMEGRTPLPAGPQAEEFLRRHLSAGPDPGATLGLARQAVAPGCRACGQCLHGCPWRLIWSAAQRLPALAALPGFTYRPGAPVRRFAEGPEGVTLTLADGSSVTGSRAFLAAGVLESARILLASQPVPDKLTLLDSQHGFLPALQRRATRPRPDRMPHHTLTQLFLEIDDPALSPYLVHAQIYGWNDFYARDLIASYGRRLPGSAPLWRLLARRLMVAQIFLHSDHSARA